MASCRCGQKRGIAERTFDLSVPDVLAAMKAKRTSIGERVAHRCLMQELNGRSALGDPRRVAEDRFAAGVAGFGHSLSHHIPTTPPPRRSHRRTRQTRNPAVLHSRHGIPPVPPCSGSVLIKESSPRKRQYQGHHCHRWARDAVRVRPAAARHATGTRCAHSNCGDRRWPTAARRRAQLDRYAAGTTCDPPRPYW